MEWYWNAVAAAIYLASAACFAVWLFSSDLEIRKNPRTLLSFSLAWPCVVAVALVYVAVSIAFHPFRKGGSR